MQFFYFYILCSLRRQSKNKKCIGMTKENSPLSQLREAIPTSHPSIFAVQKWSRDLRIFLKHPFNNTTKSMVNKILTTIKGLCSKNMHLEGDLKLVHNENDNF